MRAALVIAAVACSAPAKQQQQQPKPQPDPQPLEGKRVTPTRLCYTDGTLVFENNCGCDEALVCRIDRIDGTHVVVSLATDLTHPSSGCDDCFAMVPARCAILPRPRAVVVNTLTIELPDDGCWVAGR